VKSAGSIRASKWSGDIYTERGVRREYWELSSGRKEAIQKESKRIAKEMYANLFQKTVNLIADGQTISVGFTKQGVEHVARDAMLTLSGKYMSRTSMVNIDKILAQSKYVPTDQVLYKTRKDGKSLFFKYEDSDGRGIYFKIAYEPKQGSKKWYNLYSVSDK